VDGLLAWRERVDKREAEHKASGGGEEAKEVRRLSRRLEEVESLCIDMARTLRRHDKALGGKGDRLERGSSASPSPCPSPSPPRARRPASPPTVRLGDADVATHEAAAAAQWEAQIDALHASLKASLCHVITSAAAAGQGEAYRAGVVQGLDALETVLGGEGTRLVGSITDSLQVLRDCIAPPPVEAEGPRQAKEGVDSPGRDNHHHGKHGKHGGKRDLSSLPPPPLMGQLEKGARAEEKTIVLASQDEALLSPPPLPDASAPQPSNV
jgi:hypothetical protein